MLLAASSDISVGGVVTVYLLAIVFAVLALLIVVLALQRKIMALVQTIKDKRAQKKNKHQETPVPEAPQVLDGGEDEEEIAAIMAAISIVMQSNQTKHSQFVVRKIERI